MISEISANIYTKLSQDSILQNLLPHVKDNNNIWEQHRPANIGTSDFPAVTYRISNGSPIQEVLSLDAISWDMELEVFGNTSSMSILWQIYERIYDLLHNRDVSAGTSHAYKCAFEFLKTDYDKTTDVNFILTRFQIYSTKIPSTNVGTLS